MQLIPIPSWCVNNSGVNNTYCELHPREKRPQDKLVFVHWNEERKVGEKIYPKEPKTICCR